MSADPSPESLKAAEAILVRLHEWSGRARYLMENEPNPQELIGDEVARHIDAAFADLRERCERLEAENSVLKIQAQDADILFGDGWHESYKASAGKPHEAAHSQMTRLAGTVSILKAVCELADFYGDFSNHPNGHHYVRDEIRAALSPTPKEPTHG